MKNSNVCHTDSVGLLNLFQGKSVRKISGDTLQLSDGTVLEIHPNEGGCSCGAGDYEITELNECDNIITNVELVATDHVIDDPWETPPTTYALFVYAGDRKINLLTVDGDDGNGYYGSGFWIHVNEMTDA